MMQSNNGQDDDDKEDDKEVKSPLEKVRENRVQIKIIEISRKMILLLSIAEDFETVENIKEYFCYLIQRKTEIEGYSKIFRGIFNHSTTIDTLIQTAYDY